MGADGGVCWVPVKDPTKYDRAIGLIRPFYGLLESGMADWQEDACSRWERRNSWCGPPNYIQGYYGSFQDYDLNQVAELLINADGEEIVEDSTITFGELLEDLATRPMCCPGMYLQSHSQIKYLLDFKGRPLSLLEVILWEFFGWRKNITEDKDFDIIRNMKVLDWVEELGSLCDWKRCASEETWT